MKSAKGLVFLLLFLLCLSVLLSSCSFGGSVTIYRAGTDSYGRFTFSGETIAIPANVSVYETFALDSALEPWEQINAVSCITDENKAFVELTEEYADLGGIDSTIIDACVVYTLTEFDYINSVVISSKGLSQSKPPFTRRDFNLDELGLDPRDVEFVLYFPHENYRYVEMETNNVSLREKDYAWYLVEMLIAGPKDHNLKPIIPEGTKLLTLSVEDGLCSLGFSNEFVTKANGSFESARMTLVCLVNSLTGLQNIDAVAIYLEGSLLTEYFGHDISAPLKRDDTAVKEPVDGVDVDFYYLDSHNKPEKTAVFLPYQSFSGAYDKLSAYFSSPAPLGLIRPSEDGTTLLSVDITGFTAKIRLSKEPQPGLEGVLLAMLEEYGVIEIIFD